MRAALDTWFDSYGVQPQLVGEFEDSALMQVCSSGGRGFTVVHTVVERAVLRHYNLRVIKRVEDCGTDFYAITAERRLKHPAAAAITEHAYTQLVVFWDCREVISVEEADSRRPKDKRSRSEAGSPAHAGDVIVNRSLKLITR
jgi:hypothetical protein